MARAAPPAILPLTLGAAAPVKVEAGEPEPEVLEAEVEAEADVAVVPLTLLPLVAPVIWAVVSMLVQVAPTS